MECLSSFELTLLTKKTRTYMLDSVWRFCEGFFFDSDVHTKDEEKEGNTPYVKPGSKTDTRRRQLHGYSGRPRRVTRLSGVYRRRGIGTELNNRVKKKPVVSQIRRKLPSFVSYLNGLFSNGTSDVDELRQLHSNFTSGRRSDATESNIDGIKRRLENSELLKRKLSELRYDRRQLEKLERVQRQKGGGGEEQYCEPRPARTLNDDRVLLTQRELRILRRDLNTRDRELRLANERIRLLQDQNRRLVREVERLKLELNQARSLLVSEEHTSTIAPKADVGTTTDHWEVSGSGL